MRAGELREKITFEEPIRVVNDSGGYDTTYTTALSTYSKVEEISSNPEMLGSQQDVIQSIRITIRYRPIIAIKNGFVAVWRGFRFVVNNIKVDPLRTKIEIILKQEINTSIRETEVSPCDDSFTYTFPFNLGCNSEDNDAFTYNLEFKLA